MILGIDEAGRGPWAGPLVVGAVVLGGAVIAGLDDSKKLTKKRREALEPIIQQQANAWALGWVTSRELDEIGMSTALRLATRRAVEQIHAPYHEIIIDGTVNFLEDTLKSKYVKTMPKADSLIPSVSAASVLAKVARDRYMAEIDETYPGYGFAKHAGYGVAAHRAAIDRIGVCPEHRLSFAPLQKYGYGSDLPGNSVLTPTGKWNGKCDSRTTRAIGNESESVAARHLKSLGHQIFERNWRTKWCEIDIISCKNDTIYFTEVKHRKNDKAGDGLAAITPKKRRQMTFAAELYVASNHIADKNLQLCVITTTGEPPHVVDYLELLES